MAHDSLRSLKELFRHNKWANARVFTACHDLPETLLQEEAPGTVGTVETTLKHLVGNEDFFLAMIEGRSSEEFGSREAYFAQDLAWFRQRLDPLGDAYLTLLASLDDAALDRTLNVPWFDFPLTAHDGLLQVLTHSAQHRAQILSILGARGIDVPNIDYVFMRREEQKR